MADVRRMKEMIDALKKWNTERVNEETDEQEDSLKEG